MLQFSEKSMSSKRARRSNRTNKPKAPLRKLIGDQLGSHKHALEYAIIEYALKGYNAATINRKLKTDYPNLLKHDIRGGSIFYLLKRASKQGVITMHKPRVDKLERELSQAYERNRGPNVTFYVVDEIGFRHAQSISSVFWSVAADAIAEAIDKLVASIPAGDSNAEIVIGNTGGPAVSNAIQQLSKETLDPEFVASHGHRLRFLSLTAAGSAEHFDVHSNYLAALMGQVYGAKHMAAVTAGQNDVLANQQLYNQKIASLRMIIGGVGSDSGFLMNWFNDQKVPRPPEMIGDIFFHPLDANGRILSLNEQAQEAVAPLQLRPTRDELREFLNPIRETRSVVIVTERSKKDGSGPPDKCKVLDVALRAGFITDCVLSASLADRLLTMRKLSNLAHGNATRGKRTT
jgi:hypothetical protein